MNDPTQPEMISIFVNGERQQVQRGSSVKVLLAELEIQSRAIAVEVNEQIVAPVEFSEATFQNGDRVEIVTLVGGG